MTFKLTKRGQLTIPKKVRKRLGLKPGTAFDLTVDESAGLLICKLHHKARPHSVYEDRFDHARGSATIKWTTDELMSLLRGT